MARRRWIIAGLTVLFSTGFTAVVGARHGHTASPSALSRLGQEHEETRKVGAASCGVERWPVKTLTDSDRGRVRFLAHPARVGYLGSLAPQPGGQSTRSPLEQRVYHVNGVLTRVKRESDSDYHLVLADEGASLIAEMPYVGCDAGARFRPSITGARAALDNILGGPVATSWRYPKLRVQITGVLFFDFAHGQTGHAPNYVELHPVLGIRVLP
jgi:hypothetical protein